MFNHSFFTLLSVFLILPTAIRSVSPTCPQVTTCLAALANSQSCPLFPMLPGTFSQPPGPQGFTVTKLRPGVFHYSDDAYHAIILYSPKSKRLVVIDFPRSPNSLLPDGSYLLINATRQVIAGRRVKIVDMVYSHRHLDHIGAASIFQQYITNTYPSARLSVRGTEETRSFLLRHPDTPVPLPTVIISHRPSTITLSPNTRLRLSILGGHTTSDVLAYIPPTRTEEGVVHYPDIVTAGEAPFIQFVLTVDLGRYVEVHRDLLKIRFKHFSTGHGMLATKKDVSINLAYTEFVIKAARDSAAEQDPAVIGGLFGRIADRGDVAYRNGAWALNSILDLQIEDCTRKVIKEWGCKLSVLDVFARGHCLSAVAYNFLEQ